MKLKFWRPKVKISWFLILDVFIFLTLSFPFVFKTGNVYAATAGGVTNVYGSYCNGGGANNDGQCRDAFAGQSRIGFACGADNGTDPTHCEGGWQIDTTRWNLMYNSTTGYYEIGKWVWPLATSGTSQNDWVCKVQIDIYTSGRWYPDTPDSAVVWRDPDRCGTPPPPTCQGVISESPVTPPDGSTGISTTTSFAWSINAPSCTNSSTLYLFSGNQNIAAGNCPAGTNLVGSASGLGTTASLSQLGLSSLQANAPYTWRVNAYNSVNNPYCGPGWHFTTAATTIIAPAKPLAISPSGTISTVTPTYTSQDQGLTDSYPLGYHDWHWQVYKSDRTTLVWDYGWEPKTTASGQQASINSPPGPTLTSGKSSYSWRTQDGSGPGYGASPWSDWKDFTVDTPPACDNISFSIGATGSKQKVTITDLVTDDVSVNSIQFYANTDANGGTGGTWQTLTPSPFTGLSGTSVSKSVDWTSSYSSYSRGTHVIAVNAYDSTNNFMQCTKTYSLGSLTVTTTPSTASQSFYVTDSNVATVGSGTNTSVGSFTLAPWVYQVHCGNAPAGYGGPTYSSTPLPSTTNGVVSVAGGQTTAVTCTYSLNPVTLSGHVYQTGTTIPIVGTTLKLTVGNIEPTTLATTTSDSNGFWSFANISPQANLSVTSYLPPGYNYSVPATTSCAGTSKTNISVLWSSPPLGNCTDIIFYGTNQSTQTLTVHVSNSDGVSGGTITSNPSGINCNLSGGTCQASFSNGASVILTETPNAGSAFNQWSQDCSGSGSTCTVLMNQSRSVDASFKAQPPPTSLAGTCNASGNQITWSWTPTGYYDYWLQVNGGSGGRNGDGSLTAANTFNTWLANVGQRGAVTYTTTTTPGTSYYAIVKDTADSGYTNQSAWYPLYPASAVSVTCNVPPSLSSLHITDAVNNTTDINVYAVPDNSHQYTVAVSASDANGASDIVQLDAFINQFGENANSLRGYLSWKTFTANPDNGSYFFGSKQCNLGWATLYDPPGGNFGRGYLHIVSCSVVSSGNTRTASFVITLDPSYTTPIDHNDIAGYAADAGNLTNPYTNFDTDFNLNTLIVKTTGAPAPTFYVTGPWSATQVVLNPSCTGVHPNECPGPGPINFILAPLGYQVQCNLVSGYSPPIYSGSPTPLTNSGNGAYTFPPAGQIETVTCTYSQPSVAPNTPLLVAPPNNAWINYNPTFTATVSDANGGNVTAQFDLDANGTIDGSGSTVASGGNSLWTPASIADTSARLWRANALDPGGLTSAWTTPNWTLKKDTVLPIVNTATTTLTNGGSSISLAFTASDDRSGLAVNGFVHYRTKPTSSATWGVYTNLTQLSGSDTPANFTFSCPGRAGCPTITSGNDYQFRYQVLDNAGSWGSWVETNVVSAAATGTISGTVFLDDGSGGGTAGDGLQTGGEVGTGLATIYATGSLGSPVAGTLNADGTFSFGSLALGNYRLEIGPNYSYDVTKWSLENTTANNYGAKDPITGRSPTSWSNLLTVSPSDDNGYPLKVTAGGATTASLGLKQLPTGNVTLKMINDVDAVFTTVGDDQSLGATVRIKCQPSGPGCDSTTGVAVTGTTSLSLLVGQDYTFTYDANGTSYQLVTGGTATSGTCTGFVCTMSSAWIDPATVSFYVTGNSAPWLQVWDGDVYSDCDPNAVGTQCPSGQNGINIHVNGNAVSPHRSADSSTVNFVKTTSGGGIALAKSGLTCNGYTCSEKSWQIGSYAGQSFPDLFFAQLSASDPDVKVITGDTTITSQTDFAGKKVILVRGNATIDAAGGNGDNDDLTGFIVATGNIIINGSGANELTVKGGLIAVGSFIFNLSLNDNKHSLLTVKYDATFLTNPSATSKLTLPTYTWREVAPGT